MWNGQDPHRPGSRACGVSEGVVRPLHNRRCAGQRVARSAYQKRLLRLQKQLAACRLLIIYGLGFVHLSRTGAELLFEVFSQRYESDSILATRNLLFDEWTEVFGSKRLTGALLDRQTHHVHILEMNDESYRLRQSRKRRSNKQAKPQESVLRE